MLRKPAVYTGLLLLTALSLAWVSNDFGGLAGWGSFTLILSIAALAVYGGLRLLSGKELPAWMPALIVGAALLRLFAAAFWLWALPQYGHDTPVQEAGYIMEDAYVRDQAAWKLARSGESLRTAFTDFRGADQYGGLLFLSAFLYRYAGGSTHQPLLIVALLAPLSALVLPFAWAFARQLFGARAAGWAAVGLALYPEAVLLGSTQMREPLIVSLAAISAFGLLLYWSSPEFPRRKWSGVALMAAPVLVTLPITPTYALIMVFMLALLGLGLSDWKLVRSWRLWLALLGAAVLIVGFFWITWDQIAPELTEREFETPLEMAAYWVELSARWQANQTVADSGVLQSVVERTPEWVNLPFILGYGVLRPLLPAQLFAGENALWWGIGIWRSAGWAVLLLSILISPLLLLRSAKRRWIDFSVVVAAFASLLIASYWGGGDQWDNPRYRLALVFIQVSLAAWVWVSQVQQRDPWVRRLLGAGLALLLWIGFWYLRRYTVFDQIFGWTVIDVFKVLGAGLATGLLYILWDIVGVESRRLSQAPKP